MRREDYDDEERDSQQLLEATLEQIEEREGADYRIARRDLFEVLKWAMGEQGRPKPENKATSLLEREVKKGRLGKPKSWRFTAGHARNLVRRYFGNTDFEEVDGSEERLLLGTYIGQDGLEDILSNPKRLARFDVHKYVEGLGRAVEVSSGELRVLMMMWDVQNGLPPQYEKFYYDRMRVAKDGALSGRVIGRREFNGATYSYLFPRGQVREFFFNPNHGYAVQRPKMRQNLRGQEGKDDSPNILFSLQTATFPAEFLASLTGFGRREGEFYLGVTTLKSSTYRDCVVPLLGKNDQPHRQKTIRFRYTPHLLVDEAAIQGSLLESYGDEAKEMSIFHLQELRRMGRILPEPGMSRTYRLENIVLFLEEMALPPTEEGEDSFGNIVMNELRERLEMPGVYVEPEIIQARQKKGVHWLTAEEIGASSLRIQEKVGDTPNEIGTREAWRIIRTYLESSGRNGTSRREHLYDAFDGAVERKDILDLLKPRKEESRGGHVLMEVPSLLISLYDQVKERFILSQEQAFSRVRDYFSARGLPIGHKVIREALLGSRPIQLTELVEETEEVLTVSDSKRGLEERDPYKPVAKTQILFRPESIDDALSKMYGDFNEGEIVPGYVIPIVRAIGSLYFSGNIPVAIIEDELKPYRVDLRKKVENNPWETRTVRLLTEILILKHGLVDDIKHIPDIEQVKRDYQEITGGELDMREFAIQDNSISNLIVRAGRLGMHEEYVHGSALARLNRDLHQRMLDLASHGKIYSYQIDYPGTRRHPEACFRLTDVLRIAEAERLTAGTEGLGNYMENRRELLLSSPSNP
ncbi:hypothetical protein HYT52_01395 [Candidatus Woesearchaeota archaeon]|nr:hypothetical protein [Candidatus Woesearchaeota archaeon]